MYFKKILLRLIEASYSINRLGNVSDIAGKRTTSISTKRLTSKKGNPALLTAPMDTFPILDATKRHTPTGGVVKPIIKFKTAITAKWTGSTPTTRATFKRMGNNICIRFYRC